MDKEKVTEMFGSMVFNEDVMKRRLSTTCYKAWNYVQFVKTEFV